MKYNWIGIATVGVGLLLLAGPVFGFIPFGRVATASIAQGNVYDIYSTNPSTGTTVLLATCQSFTYMQSLQAANPNNSYSGVPDPSCGPINLVTSTVVGSTTFSNPCPSTSTTGQYSIQGCTYTTLIVGTVTSTVLATTTQTTTQTVTSTVLATTTQTTTQTVTSTAPATTLTQSATTSVLTVTSSGLTTTQTVTQQSTGSGLPFGLYLTQIVGLGFLAVGGATFVMKRPKGA